MANTKHTGKKEAPAAKTGTVKSGKHVTNTAQRDSPGQIQPKMINLVEEPAMEDETEELQRRAHARIAKLRTLSFNINVTDPNKNKQIREVHSTGAIAIMGGDTEKAESLMTPLEKMQVARGGISKKIFEILKEKTGLDYSELAGALSVTRSTLISKKGEDKFSSELSERIVSIADIYSYGYEVFEDQDKFRQWMFRPNKALGGEAPYDLINNQFGREEVRNIIGRIDYGVYS